MKKEKKETMLERAKKIKPLPKTPYSRVEATDEHFELIMAWARQEISYRQLSIITGRPVRSGNVLYYVANVFKQGVQQGKIIYKK